VRFRFFLQIEGLGNQTVPTEPLDRTQEVGGSSRPSSIASKTLHTGKSDSGERFEPALRIEADQSSEAETGMATDEWNPAAESLTTTDEGFFANADLVLPATIDLPHSAAQIWEALTDDRLGAWMPIVDRARWADPQPRSRGAQDHPTPAIRDDRRGVPHLGRAPGGRAVPSRIGRHRHRAAEPRPPGSTLSPTLTRKEST
jgi:hypothetical protein